MEAAVMAVTEAIRRSTTADGMIKAGKKLAKEKLAKEKLAKEKLSPKEKGAGPGLAEWMAGWFGGGASDKTAARLPRKKKRLPRKMTPKEEGEGVRAIIIIEC
jgi:hypothetical protein